MTNVRPKVDGFDGCVEDQKASQTPVSRVLARRRRLGLKDRADEDLVGLWFSVLTGSPGPIGGDMWMRRIEGTGKEEEN